MGKTSELSARDIISRIYDGIGGDARALMPQKKSLIKKVTKWKMEIRGKLPEEPKTITELGNHICSRNPMLLRESR